MVIILPHTMIALTPRMVRWKEILLSCIILALTSSIGVMNGEDRSLICKYELNFTGFHSHLIPRMTRSTLQNLIR